MIDVRNLLIDAYRSALSAVDPRAAVERALEDRDLPATVRVVAIGKAAGAMAMGAAAIVGDRLVGGLVISDHETMVPAGLRLMLGSHPYPDSRSVAAGRAALSAASAPADLLLFLISGGGSSLAEIPANGLTIETLAQLHRRLMDTGTPIEELNTVRRHLSGLKHGRLLAAARAPEALTLLVSDVLDSPASAIASGPTLIDDSTPDDAIGILVDRLGEIPSTVRGHLEHSPSPPRAAHHQYLVVADRHIAAKAAAAHLHRHGWTTRIKTEPIAGEARRAACDFIAETIAGEVLVGTGETTVTVRGSGRGGRNQEAALAGAIEIAGTETVFAAFATDGIDGMTAAAGAVVDGNTTNRMIDLVPEAALANNDSGGALARSGDLVVTGPSGTNVSDIWFCRKV